MLPSFRHRPCPLSHLAARRPSRPMSTRPQAWKSAAPPPLNGSLTFAAQPALQRLPVADLASSLAKLKESLKPLARTDSEYATAKKKIDRFARSPQAVELHARLVSRAAQTSHWLEQWWDDIGYLGYRDSVVVNVSYYYGFDSHPSHLAQSPAARAAALTRAAMIFRQHLRRGLLKPESTKDGPLCMDTYRWMFDCCRVPGPEGLDWCVTHAKEGDLGDSGHIVVFRKNRPWKVDTAKDGRLLSTAELERQFQHIYDTTSREYPGVGVLTASNRDVWAKDYAELLSSSQNAQIIHTIQSAAFTVSLDASFPTGSVWFSRALWHGDHQPSQGPIGLRNRWVDKPVQFIVFDNAQAGIMGEHSVMDGTPTARMCDDILDWLQDPSFDHGTPTDFTCSPTPLDWHVSPQTHAAIAAADQAATALIESQTLGFHLTSYGKAAIKRFGVSPDSWAQMIIQLAHRRLLAAASASGSDGQRVGATYEAATTRRFFKGRTEAIRVVSTESDRWVASMDDPSVGKGEKKRLFGEATQKHLALARESGMGMGVDRLMLGLKKVLKEGEELPEMFSDPLVARSSYWVLSTSAIFSKHFPVYGWGEVVPDGFGVAYMTGYDDRLQFTVTSRKEMPNAEFCKEISRAAIDLYELFQLGAGQARL